MRDIWEQLANEPNAVKRGRMWREHIRTTRPDLLLSYYRGHGLWSASQHCTLPGSPPHPFLQPRRPTRKLVSFPKEPFPADTYHEYTEDMYSGAYPYIYQHQRLSSYGYCGYMKDPPTDDWYVRGDYHAPLEEGVCPRCNAKVEDCDD